MDYVLGEIQKISNDLKMSSVLVISSFVAGSNVGGSLAMKVLPVFGHEVALLPTTMLGRHPGWGAPGGGAVPQEIFAGMADGLIANQIPQSADVIITGYFASAEQVALAAELIREHASKAATVIVDTIMGDFGKGLYVKEEVAEAIVRDLIPLASLVKGNAWEFWEVERRLGRVDAAPESPRDLKSLACHVKHAPARQGKWLVTSVEDGAEVGMFGFHERDYGFGGIPRLDAAMLPNGIGDFVTLMLACQPTASIVSLHDDIAVAMGALPLLLEGQVKTELSELSLEPLSGIAALKPRGFVRDVW